MSVSFFVHVQFVHATQAGEQMATQEFSFMFSLIPSLSLPTVYIPFDARL